MNNADTQYLSHMKNIMLYGREKGDRTGTGTKSIFGHQMRFDLREGFPLLTTKKVHLKSIIHELLWFLNGDTNVKYLQDNGVKIWDKWADERGELGPVYGKQWRDWGGSKRLENEYGDTEIYGIEGIDQLQDVINRLKTNPECRRLIVSAWNPADIEDMALPPCHCFFQFIAEPMTDGERFQWVYSNGSDELLDRLNDVVLRSDVVLSTFEKKRTLYLSELDKEFDIPKYFLSCQLYQRSADWFLGVPFNIASYSLLTMMLAQVVNMVPKDFVHTFGDSHLYLNHMEQASEQLSRKPFPDLPIMKINNRGQGIDEFLYEDFELVGYECHPAIKAPVAV